MKYLRVLSKTEIIIIAVGLAALGLVAVQMYLIQGAVAHYASLLPTQPALGQELLGAREEFTRYSGVVILLVLAVFLALVFMLIRNRRAAAQVSKALESKIRERTAELADERKNLKEQEAQYRRIVETADEAILTTNAQEEFVYANPRATEILGYAASELMGMQPDDLLFQEEIPGRKRRLQERHQGKRTSADLRIRRKDGTERWVHASASPFFSDEPKYAGTLFMVTDITERKRTQDALALSEQLHRSLLDAMPLCVFRKDVDGRITYGNARFWTSYGLNEQETLGKTEYEISPRELADMYRHDDLHVMETGETLDLVEEYAPAGTPRTTIRVLKSRVLDASGKVDGVQVMYWDLSESKRQGEKLREREELLSRILDTVEDGIYIVDQNGKMTFANRATQRIVGVSSKEIAQSAYDDPRWQTLTVDGKPFPQENQPFARVKATGEPVYDVEQSILRSDGSRVTVSINAAPLHDANGKLIGEVASMTDITARIRVQEKLRENERMLAKAQEIAHIGSWRWEFPDCVEWSDEMFRIWGLEPQESEVSLAELMAKRIHPTDRARVELANERAIRLGEPTPTEYRIVRPNGEVRVVWAEGEIVKNSDGKPVGMIGVLQDITERKRAQAAEGQLAAIVKSSNDAIVSKSLDGLVTSWNFGAERLHGYTAAEMLGKPISLIVPPERSAEAQEAQRRLLAGEPLVHLETERFRKDGSRIQMALTFSPLYDENGHINGTAAIARDITEQKRAEAELRRQNEYLDALHETTINLMGRLELNDLLQAITQRAANLVGTENGYIYLNEPGSDEMEMSVGIGVFEQMVGTKARRGMGATGTVWESGQVFVIDDYQTWGNRLAKPGVAQVRSLVTIPLKSGAQVVGVFGLANTDVNERFDETDVNVLSRFAHLASIALDNARLYAAAEQELAERAQAEDRFHRLFAASPDAILLLDPNQPDWPIVDCNQVACDMNGYTREELIGKSIDLLNVTPGTESERAEYLEAVRRAGVLHVEAEHRHKEGYHFTIETSTSLLTMGDHELVLGIDRDVTERKRVENALRENRARLASLMNNTNDLIMSIDRDLKLTVFNEPFRNLVEMGLGKQVHGGESVLELVEPETLPTHVHYYERAFAGERCHYETQMTIADHPTLHFETYLNPIYGDEQEVTGLAIFTRDITERKAAEQALTQQKELLQTVFDNSPVMIGMFDANGRYTLINHEWEHTLGYTLEEMNSGDVMAAMYPDGDERLAARGFMLVPSPGWRDFKTLVRDGQALDTSWAYVPLSEGMTLAFGQDITRRKEVDRLKNEFISTVSHELRTPLTSIRGSLGLIAGGVAGPIPDRAKNMIDIAYKNSERLVRLINDILDIEKIESGKMELRFKPIELVPLIEQAVEANRSYGEQYQVSFVIAKAPPNLRINADADRMTQVLTNLLSNAAKFSPPHSEVEIRVRHNGKQLHVEVCDHGAGIPEEFKNRIFQKFAQADSSDTRQKGGTGLGLSIVKAIIEKHGGTIGFNSTVGMGTTFYFNLPEYQETPRPVLTPESQKQRILIVEDDQDVALLLNLMLKQGGFETDVAYNAEDALELVQTRHYAALTLDLMLPGKDGISLIRDMRANEHTRHLPIVVVSAKAEHGKQQLNGDAMWVADWLQKPIDQHQLVRAVAQASKHLRRGKPHILHIEDDSDVQNVVSAILQDTADITSAFDFAQARELLEREEYDLILLDPALPDGSGTELLPLLRGGNARIPVVIFSAREEDPRILDQVNAALVKSRTSNEQLLKTIAHLIEPVVTGEKK